MKTFYLGTHHENWLWGGHGVPLFVSRRRLVGRDSYGRADCNWVLDSGGFTELSQFGRWTVSPARYASEARYYTTQIGRLDWCAIMDWMCEPFVTAKTGLTVRQHQIKTLESYNCLRSLAPDVKWAPVLQGWHMDDYLRHVEMYRSECGVDLSRERVVGVGSVCRRQGTGEIENLFTALAGLKIRCHGFGVKMNGLSRSACHLESADSMAWSIGARRDGIRMPGCTTHKNCANCPVYALEWRRRVMKLVEEG